MGDADKRAPRAGAQDLDGPQRTHGVRLYGFVSLPVIQDAMRRFDAAIERDATIEAVVLDALDIDGFEPGIPARFVQWLAQNAGQVRAAVLVTLSPVLVATVRASELLLPHTEISAAQTRSAALAIAVQGVASRQRVSTGIQRTRPTPPAISRRKIAG